MSLPIVKATIGYKGGFSATCPYCGKTHFHNPPLGDGQRMADCFQGEYIITLADQPEGK